VHVYTTKNFYTNLTRDTPPSARQGLPLVLDFNPHTIPTGIPIKFPYPRQPCPRLPSNSAMSPFSFPLTEITLASALGGRSRDHTSRLVQFSRTRTGELLTESITIGDERTRCLHGSIPRRTDTRGDSLMDAFMSVMVVYARPYTVNESVRLCFSSNLAAP